MYRSGLVDMLVTHANTKGFDLTSLSGVWSPPWLYASSVKKQRNLDLEQNLVHGLRKYSRKYRTNDRFPVFPEVLPELVNIQSFMPTEIKNTM